MSTSPQFSNTPNVGLAQISVANPNRDGTGTLVTAFTPGGSGGRIDKCVIKASGTTTAGTVRLFLKVGAGTAFLLTEVPVAPVTVGANTPAFETVIDFLGGLVLPTGTVMQAATNNAETFNVIPLGGNL